MIYDERIELAAEAFDFDEVRRGMGFRGYEVSVVPRGNEPTPYSGSRRGRDDLPQDHMNREALARLSNSRSIRAHRRNL